MQVLYTTQQKQKQKDTPKQGVFIIPTNYEFNTNIQITNTNKLEEWVAKFSLKATMYIVAFRENFATHS